MTFLIKLLFFIYYAVLVDTHQLHICLLVYVFVFLTNLRPLTICDPNTLTRKWLYLNFFNQNNIARDDSVVIGYW